MKTTIRSATIADLSSVLEIEKLSPTAAHWSTAEYESALRDSVPRRLLLLIEGAGKVLGFLMARLVEREVEIENIVVSPDSQGVGLGSQLMREFLRLAREDAAESVRLEVRESNHSARNFYGKFGFAESAIRREYYHNPEEAAVQYVLYL